MLSSGGTEEEWKKTQDAQKILVELHAKDRQRRLCQEQAERLAVDSKDTSGSLRRSFIRLFTTSKLGLGILSTGAGKRGSRRQSRFRKELIETYNSRYPDNDVDNSDLLWCPILSSWMDKNGTCAAHIFGYMNGQESMTAIFGATESPELWSPRNGMLIASSVEARFDSGLFVIVPDLPENASAAEISAWNDSESKEYKLRIIDSQHPNAGKWVINKEMGLKWRDLDNKRLEFRNSFRPRARYLYYHYCTQLLRCAWNEEVRGNVLKRELKKRFWGTPGKYIRESMLRAFVEELGHDFDYLLDGAAPPPDDEDAADAREPDPSLLLAATNQIESVVKEDTDAEDEEEDDDDDENDDDDHTLRARDRD